jgi:hypothetical protein
MSYIGNRASLPTSERYLEDVGVAPTKLRVYWDDDRESHWWQVDGIAVIDGVFFYTEEIRCYPTWQEAISELPNLVGVLGVPA